jgi:hypothetical protein
MKKVLLLVMTAILVLSSASLAMADEVIIGGSVLPITKIETSNGATGLTWTFDVDWFDTEVGGVSNPALVPIPNNTSVSITGSGTQNFDFFTDFDYPGPGVYKFTVAESGAAVAGWTKSSAEYTVNVFVTQGATDLEINAISCVIEALDSFYDGDANVGDKVTAAIFTNTLLDRSGTLVINKTTSGSYADPATAFNFEVVFTGADDAILNGITVTGTGWAIDGVFGGPGVKFAGTLANGESVLFRALNVDPRAELGDPEIERISNSHNNIC